MTKRTTSINHPIRFPELSITLEEMDKILDSKGKQIEIIIESLKKMTQIERAKLDKSTKNFLYSNIGTINHILKQYPIKTFDDYEKISSVHLTEMLLCIIRINSALHGFLQHPSCQHCS